MSAFGDEMTRREEYFQEIRGMDARYYKSLEMKVESVGYQQCKIVPGSQVSIAVSLRKEF